MATSTISTISTLSTLSTISTLSTHQAVTGGQLLGGLDTYMAELAVMPPYWDTNTRLDPPRTSQVRTKSFIN